MTNEIKEILDFLSSENYYIQDIDCKFKRLYLDEVNKLLDYITNLQEKIDQYENPDDMGLFYMWLDTKAKDKIKKLQEENEKLLKKSYSDDVRITKATEYINDRVEDINNGGNESEYRSIVYINKILQGEDK